MKQTLGERLRELREAKDLSLRELAKKIGVSPAFLSDIELGRRNPSDEVLAKLAKHLGTTEEDLRSFDSRPPVEELRKRAAADPAYGFAFPRIVEEGKTSEEIIKWLDQNKKNKKA